MVRFKVIKGAHLLLGAVIVILTLVVAIIAIDLFSDSNGSVSAQANFVQSEEKKNSEAETGLVFASLVMQENALELDPGTDMLDIEIIPSSTVPAKVPSVLIYHTHTHEAYEQVDGDQYVAVEAWRTHDQDHSVVRVGSELAKLLMEHGFEVVHDTSDNELNDLSTAYTRSLNMLESYDRPFDLYIDLHRDAYVKGVDDVLVKEGEKTLSQLMLLIGNGEGFDTKPYYSENLAFAEALTQRINEIKPELCKNVLIKDGRYNQNIGVFSILLEVGHNLNTLQEALNSLPYFADALFSLMISEPIPELIDAQQRYFMTNR